MAKLKWQIKKKNYTVDLKKTTSFYFRVEQWGHGGVF